MARLSLSLSRSVLLCRGCCDIILLLQLFSLCKYALCTSLSHTCTQPFPIQTLFFLFYIGSSCMIYGLGFCWRVWCAISGIIKLSINDSCSHSNTCVTQQAAVSDVVHISYVLCPYGSVLPVFLYEISYSLFSIQDLLHSHILETNTLYRHLIYQSLFLILCVLSPYLLHKQHTLQARNNTHTHTHKR